MKLKEQIADENAEFYSDIIQQAAAKRLFLEGFEAAKKLMKENVSGFISNSALEALDALGDEEIE